VETIGNANQEAIRKYVKDQLTELDQKEIHSNQLDLFLKALSLAAEIFIKKSGHIYIDKVKRLVTKILIFFYLFLILKSHP